MPALFIFLFKVNVALLIFCLGYYVVLRRLTFYTLNRAYLAVAIIFSSVYPLIDLSGFAQRHQQLTMPVQTVIMNWEAPAGSFVDPIIQQPNYWHWAELLFWAGAVLFAIRLLIQLLSLYKLYKNSKPGKIQAYNVRVVNTNISPFSFWQSIYINPENLNPADLKNILQHEQIHIKEWHTLDILLTEISVIFYWFNPGIWLMKKAVRENIEFITDRKILQKGTDSKAYQYSLLNVSFSATTSAGITNHFNFSTLKKRIQMMNAKRSSNLNLTRYAFLVPAVVSLLFVVSLSKAELVKQGKAAYKAVSASVNNLTAVIQPVPVKPVKIKKQTPEIVKTDTDKKTLNNIRIITDITNTTDTSKKATITSLKLDDSATYYIDGKKSSKEEVNKIDPHNIESYSVLRDYSANKIILVKTRNGQSTSPVQPGDVKSTSLYGSKSSNNLTFTKNTLDTTQTAAIVISNVPSLRSRWFKDNMKDMAVETWIGPTLTLSSRNNLLKDKIVILNGEEISDINTVPLGRIETMKIRYRVNEIEINKYGDKAKNGIVIIDTKK